MHSRQKYGYFLIKPSLLYGRFTNLDAFNAKISKAASEAQLEGFEWLTEGKVGATYFAHRLLWYALQVDEKAQNDISSKNGSQHKHTPTLQERLASRLYQAFHKESKDLSDTHVLAAIAKEVGLFASKEEAVKWLESDEGDYEVNQAADVGLMNGVQSVPFLIVQVRISCYCSLESILPCLQLTSILVASGWLRS